MALVDDILTQSALCGRVTIWESLVLFSGCQPCQILTIYLSLSQAPGGAQWPRGSEHANLCVRDTEAMIRFLQTAFPEFRVRGEGISNDGTRWVHIGTNETYIALGQARVRLREELDAVSRTARREPSRL